MCEMFYKANMFTKGLKSELFNFKLVYWFKYSSRASMM